MGFVFTQTISSRDLCGQPPDAVPQASLGAIDVYSQFRLPPLKTHSTPGFERSISGLRVVKRAHALGLSANTPTRAWLDAQALLAGERSTEADVPDAATYSGNAASELNKLLNKPRAAVRVTGNMLILDEPIQISQNGAFLDLGSAVIKGGDQAYQLRIERAHKVVVQGGTFENADSGILVSASEETQVRNVTLRALRGAAIVITRSTRIRVSDNRITGVAGAGILLHEGTISSTVEQNEISANTGSSNMSGGIVLSDRNVDITSRAEAILAPDGYWAISQPMDQRTMPPHDNLILSNRIRGNASSGVYVDGATGNVIALNTIEANAKEGLCLDNGATGNVVTLNQILSNGQRWGEPDSIMARESILPGGRLPDGTPAEKVPGISIDNALYNVIFSNTIAHNFGGGIKIVRTGYLNVIGLNTVLSNNEGAGSKFHFFGIELGSAPLDVPSGELDGAASRGNILFSNAIRGNHYAGIFFAGGSDLNDIFDNVIMDAEKWALESVKPMANSSLNNLTNLPCRNISSGISPLLLRAGQARP